MNCALRDMQVAELAHRHPWLKRPYVQFFAPPPAAADGGGDTVELAGELRGIVGVTVRAAVSAADADSDNAAPLWTVTTPRPFEKGALTRLLEQRTSDAVIMIDELLSAIEPPASITAAFEFLRRELPLEQLTSYVDVARSPVWLLVVEHCNMRYVVAAKMTAAIRGGPPTLDTYELYALLDHKDDEHGRVPFLVEHGTPGILAIYKRLAATLRTFVTIDDPLSFDINPDDSVRYRGGLDADDDDNDDKLAADNRFTTEDLDALRDFFATDGAGGDADADADDNNDMMVMDEEVDRYW